MRKLLRRTLDELWLLKEGRRQKLKLEPGRYTRLVFVCKGNICRSVYAERYAVKVGLVAISRGLMTTPGCPPDPTACRIAEERGVSLAGHRTAVWNPVELSPSDVSIVMEPWQLRRVTAEDPIHAPNAALMGSWSAPARSAIADPYGRSAAVFRECFSQIESAINKMIAELNG